ncbi:acetamidase/formamidase family protein [Hyphomicrobium sp. CS1GBMeth3]|uniref:acetamidase/formamidase family protein n=1 Tax=Hyphomicrobium sp. CS1GBMeth3 TaxID=1892845 RepID=UPI000930ED1C|nr:acetamidase/formamidase family protein [Hyphomicrobium sp. CS1GBMeth3]
MTAEPLRLTADVLPLERREALWQEHLARLSLRLLTPAQTSGTITVTPSSSGARLGLLSGSPQSLAFADIGPDRPFLLLHCLRGWGSIKCQKRVQQLAEQDLCVFDMSHECGLEWRTAFDVVMFQLPRAPLASRLGRSRLDAPLSLGSTVAAAAARPLLRTLAANIETIEQADLSAGEIALTELVASAMLSELKAPDGTMTGVQAAHFRRIAAAIDRQLGMPDLALADVAREEGMSARYVQRLFERRSDSFSEYVRRQRLQRTRADLSDPNHTHESVATIALRWGFRDQAHFSRAFSAEFGVAPREMRRSIGGEIEEYARRGKPALRKAKALPRPRAERPELEPTPQGSAQLSTPPIKKEPSPDHYLPVNADTVHWGFLSRALPPQLRVNSGTIVTIETLTQHAGDDYERMVSGDPGAESVYLWTKDHKAVDRRGAGPMNASVFGRGAGEGFGVHICTGPIFINGAAPGDVLEVEILDIRPRPCGNPLYAGKAFASNVSAWWGYQYRDLLDGGTKRETITIYEIDLADPTHARAVYSYVWTPQTDPYGVVHRTIDYPGVPVDHRTVEKRDHVLTGISIPARPHFGFIAVAPSESDMVDSIPPGNFGGNIDNWRLGTGAKLFLPVAVEGALLSIGDGHFAQSDGEINGTGLECSLTGDVRLTLHKRHASTTIPCLRGLAAPLIETESHWVIQSFSYPNYLRELGLNAQSDVYARSTVDLALRSAYRQARRFLMDAYELSEDEALSLMSLAVDFGITQVADGNLGVHATIEKSIFAGRTAGKRPAAG